MALVFHSETEPWVSCEAHGLPDTADSPGSSEAGVGPGPEGQGRVGAREHIKGTPFPAFSVVLKVRPLNFTLFSPTLHYSFLKYCQYSRYQQGSIESGKITK